MQGQSLMPPIYLLLIFIYDRHVGVPARAHESPERVRSVLKAQDRALCPGGQQPARDHRVRDSNRPEENEGKRP